jgi:cytoskeletal protein RodZ
VTGPGATDGREAAAGLVAFGRWLEQERELRGLKRADVVRATKLPAGLVEALESGDAGRIPPRAYALGYLRTWAGAVGLDADEVVLRFEEAAGPIDGPAARRRRPSARAVGAVALALALLAAGLLALLR